MSFVGNTWYSRVCNLTVTQYLMTEYHILGFSNDCKILTGFALSHKNRDQSTPNRTMVFRWLSPLIYIAAVLLASPVSIQSKSISDTVSSEKNAERLKKNSMLSSSSLLQTTLAGVEDEKATRDHLREDEIMDRVEEGGTEEDYSLEENPEDSFLRKRALLRRKRDPQCTPKSKRKYQPTAVQKRCKEADAKWKITSQRWKKRFRKRRRKRKKKKRTKRPTQPPTQAYDDWWYDDDDKP